MFVKILPLHSENRTMFTFYFTNMRNIFLVVITEFGNILYLYNLAYVSNNTKNVLSLNELILFYTNIIFVTKFC